ncbi:MAG: orotate phosphoribosyltransferase [Bacteroidia bacterium]|nr:orotate phosphoribosyltransferase [Bacteroidia bacterium]
MSSGKIAEYLLSIQAVKLRVDPPFTWSSGWLSPLYCDNRMILSFPEIRRAVTEAFADEIRSRYPDAAALAGVATGAIAWGALAAELLGLPFVYIRAQAKGHGMQNLVEGRIEADKPYVVIEDLISTGKSSAQAVQALQATGAEVRGVLAIFSYGFPQADVAFAETGVSYHSLTTLHHLLEKAVQFAYLRPEDQALILRWREDPANWKP